MKETRATWCGLCHARCGLLMDFDNGKAMAVRGDPDHPTNKGRICGRGRLMIEHLYNEERLDYPLRRIGARGKGAWEKVTWDDALDEITSRLATLRDRHGPETMALTRGTGRTYEWDYARFMNLFGSPIERHGGYAARLVVSQTRKRSHGWISRIQLQCSRQRRAGPVLAGHRRVGAIRTPLQGGSGTVACPIHRIRILE